MDTQEATTVFLVLCISCFLFFASWRKRSGNGKLPPGPVSFPIVGNALQLKTKNLSRTLHKLSETYGPVFTVHFGSERVVALHGYEAVKEALIDRADKFAARGRMPIGDKFNNGLEMPFDPTFLLSCAVSNIICSIIFGKHRDYEDRKFLTLMGLMNDIFHVVSSHWGQLYQLFPSLMDVLPGPHKRMFKNVDELKKFISEEVKKHQDSLDPSSPQDIIDCFLTKMEQDKHNDKSEFYLENLVATTFDLFIAGTETPSTTLRYGLLILLKYPEIQEKVQKEIDFVIGRTQSACMANRSQMPYTDAVVHEIQRFIAVIPLGLPHTVSQDTPFRQYIIPKGTTIYPILSSVLHDSKEFPDPEQFNPEHFLNENGTFRKSNFFMPFSAGKRICLGESLARMEIFLILVTILQNFTLKPLIDPKEIDISPEMSGFGNAPKPYQLCVLPR
ncbi:cytochrome P450 2C31-like isoform X3 [Alligator sinensis]|uniref:unspecific monooxygenase n=1 Tax=Alligator sinensis TaxID=38654 RepID=A0A3Q0H5N3_ALLSI|nr:cytochrome P450 2C31-like isoform X3 [Alligator sinensis]